MPIERKIKIMTRPIEKIHAIDTVGAYPIAFIQYEGCSPSWRQYQDNKQIQDYINTHSDYEVNNIYWKY